MTKENVQELPATQEAFQRLSELWRELDPCLCLSSEPAMEPARRQRFLGDGTRISIDRSFRSETQRDAIEGRKQETLMVTVSNADIHFALTKQGVSYLRIPRLEVIIGEKSFFVPTNLHLGVSDQRIISPHPKDIFQGASLDLVGWLEEMVQMDKYGNPPISMAPSANHKQPIAA